MKRNKLINERKNNDRLIAIATISATIIILLVIIFVVINTINVQNKYDVGFKKSCMSHNFNYSQGNIGSMCTFTDSNQIETILIWDQDTDRWRSYR